MRVEHIMLLRPVLPVYKYKYRNIFVLEKCDWSGKTILYTYKYRNISVGTHFSPRTQVVLVLFGSDSENNFVLVTALDRS